MEKHSKLTRKQRYQLSTLREAGTSQKKIAEILKVHRSTIWRELKRNTPT
ncbi:MAG: helix-turn-helix domain-containing protein, partial [Flavobacteriaceae bacterium]|nr:helix-turn-helix domain-containing protein [Flavobacteriaceae bacterium]